MISRQLSPRWRPLCCDLIKVFLMLHRGVRALDCCSALMPLNPVKNEQQNNSAAEKLRPAVVERNSPSFQHDLNQVTEIYLIFNDSRY